MPEAMSWREVRARAVKDGRVTREGLAQARALHEQAERTYALQQLRETRSALQSELAERLQLSQSRVSRIESGDMEHLELSTIRAYIEGLGGRLHVTADFGDDEHLTLA